MAKQPSNKEFPKKINNIHQASDTEKVLFQRTENLLENIEQTIVGALSNIFFGATGKKTYADIQSLINQQDAVKKSVLFKGFTGKSVKTNKSVKKDKTTNIETQLKTLVDNLQKLSRNAINSAKFVVPPKNLAEVRAQNNSKKKGKAAEATINLVVSGMDKKSIESLLKLAKLNISDKSILNKDNIDEFVSALTTISESLSESNKGIDKLKEHLVKLDEYFKLQCEVANNADKAQVASAKIKKALESTGEVAIQAKNVSKDSKKTQIQLQNIGSIIIAAGLIMILGALVMKIPGMVQNALKFGVTLGIFITLVIGPIMLFSRFSGESLKAVSSLSSVILACTIVMSIGALFVMLGGGEFIKNAITFGVILGIFEALIILPFIMFRAVAPAVLSSLKQFSSCVIAMTIVMMVGALFIRLGGGKIARDALTFGFILAAFEALVITPFILFRFIAPAVLSSLKQFSVCIIVMTTILLIGAVFMTKKEYWKNALQFGFLLAAFEALVITPFILFRFIAPAVLSSLKQFTICVIVMTTILLIGAVFMSKPEYWLNTLAFGGVLAAFEALVVLPILLFSKLENSVIETISKFTLFVAMCAGVMVLGPAMIKLFGLSYGDIFVFTLNLMLFIAAIGTAIMAISAVMLFAGNKFPGVKNLLTGNIGGGLSDNVATQFAMVVGLLAGVMVLGPIIIKYTKISYGDVFVFALNLVGFVTTMGVVFALITALMNAAQMAGGMLGGGAAKSLLKGNIDGLSGGSSSNSILEFSQSVAILAGVMVLGPIIIKYTGIKYKDVWRFIGALTGFVAFMGIIFAGISAVPSNNNNSVKEFAISVAILAGVITLGPIALKLVNVSIWDVVGFGFVTGLFVTAMAFVFKRISDTKIDFKSIIMFNVTVGILATIMTAGPILFAKFGVTFDDVLLFAGGVVGFTTIMGVLFGILGGHLGAFVRVGANTAKRMLLPITILSAIMTIGPIAFKKYGITIVDALEYIGGVSAFVVATGVLFGILGTLAIPIALGSAVATAMSVGIGLLSLVIWGICNIFTTFPTAKELIANFTDVVDDIVELFNGDLSSLKLLAKTAIATANLTAISATFFCFGVAMNVLSIGLKNIRDFGELNGDILYNLTVKPITEFAAKIPDKMDDYHKKVKSIVRFSSTAGIVIRNISNAICDMANLKVAQSWDKDGKPTSFRQLSDNDFKIASENIHQIVTNMATAFQNAGTTLASMDLKQIISVLIASKEMGTVIGNIAEGVGKMAQFQVPTEYNKEGKPISFRNLKQQDFILASNAVNTVIMTLANGIMQAYNSGNIGLNGKNIFDEEYTYDSEGNAHSSSPFMRTLMASMHMGKLIGDISEGVGKMASFMVPDSTSFDPKTGKFTKYNKLSSTDFTNASKFVKEILTTIGGAIIQLYSDNPGMFDDVQVLASKGLFTDEYETSPSIFMKTLGACIEMSKMISNIAQGIGDMAKLQIPNEWDPKTGKPISFVRLTDSDFTKAGTNIGTIITSIAKSVKDAYKMNRSLFDKENADKIIQSVSSITEIVASIADTMIKLGTSQIPIYKNGKLDSYVNLDIKKTSEAIKDNLTEIVKGMCSAFSSSATILSDKFPDLMDPKSLEEYQKTKSNGEKPKSDSAKVITAVKSIVDIFASVADTMTKLAQLQIPVYKNGKLDHYEKVDVNELISLINTNFSSMVEGMVNAITSDKVKTAIANVDEKTLNSINESIKTISDTIGTVASTIENLANLKIATGFDKSGNATGYKSLLTSGNMKDLKTKFDEYFVNEGNMFEMIVSPFTNIIDKASTNSSYKLLTNTNQSTILDAIQTNISSINEVIKTILTCLTTINQSKLSGKYTKIKRDFNNLMWNDEKKSIIDELVDPFSSIGSNHWLINNDSTITTIGNSINSIFDIINVILENLKTLNESKSIIKSVLDASGKTSNIFDDISTIITKIGSIKTKLDNNKDLNTNKDVGTYISIQTSFNSIISFITSLMTSITTLNESYTTNIDSINKFNASDLCTNIATSLDSLLSIKKVIDDKTKRLKNSTDNVQLIKTSLINVQNILLTLFSTIRNIYNSYTNYKDAIDGFVSPDFTLFVNNGKVKESILYKVFNGINDFVEEVCDDMDSDIIENLNTLNDVVKSFDTLLLDETGVFAIISKMNDQLGALQNVLYANLSNNAGDNDKLVITAKIKPIITDIKNVITLLTQSFNNSNSFDLGSLATQLGEFGHSMSILSQGINNVLNAMSNAKDTSKFDKNVSSLTKFLKNSINTLDIQKLDKLTNLINALNLFADKTTNLDALTNAISNELAEVLTLLAEKMDEARGSFDTIEQIQARRHNLINSSIAKIQEIMAKQITVNVTTSIDSSEETTPSGSTTGETQTGANSQAKKAQDNGNGHRKNGPSIPTGFNNNDRTKLGTIYNYVKNIQTNS